MVAGGIYIYSTRHFLALKANSNISAWCTRLFTLSLQFWSWLHTEINQGPVRQRKSCSLGESDRLVAERVSYGGEARGGQVQRPPPTTQRPIKSDWGWGLGIALFWICLLVVYLFNLSLMFASNQDWKTLVPAHPPSWLSALLFTLEVAAHRCVLTSRPLHKMVPLPGTHSSTSLLLHPQLTGLPLAIHSRKFPLVPRKQVRTD